MKHSPDDCFRDEFEEWFFHEQGYNPFISQDDFRETMISKDLQNLQE